MGKRKDIIPGEKFARLTILHETDAISYDGGYKFRRRVMAECECGTIKAYVLQQIYSGNSKSCGCIEKDRPSRTRHGQRRANAPSGAYRTWQAMRQRCNDPGSIGWDHYGGRGIKVCARWDSFENFFADMGERPARMTLDRIDGNMGYEPGNCRWATFREQVENRRTTVIVEHLGEKHSLAEWSRILKIPYRTICQRRKKGWIPEKILAPVKTK